MHFLAALALFAALLFGGGAPASHAHTNILHTVGGGGGCHNVYPEGCI